MTQSQTAPLNEALVPGNGCFGCGLVNPAGLGIQIFQDPDEDQGLIGRFEPADHMAGFPGIIHGGVVFTALDCMAAWTGMVLKPEPKAIWVLRSAQVTYHRPAHLAASIVLRSRIEEDGGPARSIRVANRAEDEEGNVLVSGHFKVVPLLPERFKKIAGTETIPEPWASLLAEEPSES